MAQIQHITFLHPALPRYTSDGGVGFTIKKEERNARRLRIAHLGQAFHESVKATGPPPREVPPYLSSLELARAVPCDRPTAGLEPDQHVGKDAAVLVLAWVRRMTRW